MKLEWCLDVWSYLQSRSETRRATCVHADILHIVSKANPYVIPSGVQLASENEDRFFIWADLLSAWAKTLMVSFFISPLIRIFYIIQVRVHANMSHLNYEMWEEEQNPLQFGIDMIFTFI